MNLLVLVMGCAIWVPLAVWVVSLVHWMISGEVDFLSGMAGICIAIYLGYIAIKPPIPALSPLSFTAVVLTVMFYPAVRNSLERRELKAIDIEELAKAYRGLGQRPLDPMMKFKVAKQCYIMGMPGHAVAIAESVIGSMPERYFREEHRILNRWRKTPIAQDQFRAIQCVDCGTMNPPGNLHCSQCGAPFLLDRARGKILGKGQGKKLIAAWFAMVACLAGIPSATALPPALSAPLILFLLGASIALVVLAFRGVDVKA